MKEKNFSSREALRAELAERADDYEELTIYIDPNLAVAHTINGACGILERCSGKKRLISIEDAEWLLNEGLLHRNRIPIKLEKHPDA